MPAARAPKPSGQYYAAEKKTGRDVLLLLFLGRTFRTDLSKTRKILGFHLSRRFVFTADRVINFFSVDGDFFRGIDAQSDFIAADVDDGDFDVIADHDCFISLTRQHQHGKAPSFGDWAF